MPRFITVDPAHFHAALVQKEMYPDVDRRSRIVAPLGGDLLAHLQRLVGFNTRADKPTAWEAEVFAGPDFLDHLGRQEPGNIAVLAGRNARKIDYMERALEAGLHILADKPWILVPEHLPRLTKLLDSAEKRGLVAYDIMTERHEITSILQRELVQDEAVFGKPIAGSAEEPGVYVESVHYLKKLVAGVPLRRPASYFDIAQQGEGLSDVGTHLVDIVPWILFPDVALDANKDLRLVAARRWPTHLSRADYQQVTGEADFPSYLANSIDGGRLAYYCNTMVHYTLKGIHVKMDVLWGLEAQPGSLDTHLAIVRGSRSRVEIRQGKEERFKPEVYVVPNNPADKPAIRSSLERMVAALQKTHTGVGMEEQGEGLHLTIPEVLRTSHEAHFGEVTRQFLRYLRKADALPAWEKPNMIAKYFVTTSGVALASKNT